MNTPVVEETYRFDGKELRRRRIENRDSIRQLAATVSVCASSIVNYEQGRASPLVATLARLCTALDCRPEDLIVPVEDTGPVKVRKQHPKAKTNVQRRSRRASNARAKKREPEMKKAS
jgi:transcriptional regulator with XRE-family HTH domain